MFLELKQRYKEIYYYKTKNNREVAFLVKEDKGNIILIQVTAGLLDQKTRHREVSALEQAMKELGVNSALILTEDSEEIIKIKNILITVKPVYKWLINLP